MLSQRGTFCYKARALAESTVGTSARQRGSDAMKRTETVVLGGRELVFETGHMARQAHGAMVVRDGEAMVLATVVTGPAGPHEDPDFVPMTVEYRERMAAAGRIPGGWGKREGRQGDHEVLASRIIDRSLRPLFAPGFRDEVQLTVTVFGVEPGVDLEVLSVLAAAGAVQVAGLPFAGPVGAVRVVRMDDVVSVLADETIRERAELDLLVSATRDGVVMIEGGGAEVAPEQVLAALDAAAEALGPVWDALERLGGVRDPSTWPVVAAVPAPDAARAAAFAAALKADKTARRAQIAAMIASEGQVVAAQWTQFVRAQALDGVRIGARGLCDVRDIVGEVGLLPSNHGSALFTRGETQALVTATIGGPDEAVTHDLLQGRRSERFMLHYNFPSFAVGEARPARGPGRREIGHGALARRAVAAVMPDERAFAQTVRVVSDILESNGSSSMATVCGASLALMDAGVPLARAVAGVAMGLVRDGGRTAVLTDINGAEDHLGDMDFKVAATERGVTALQLDNKLGSVPRSAIAQALAEGLDAIGRILATMATILATPRERMSRHAPQSASLKVSPARIGQLIGSGGRTIQELQQSTRTRVDVRDDGLVRVTARRAEDLAAAVERIQSLTLELSVGRVYPAEVVQLKDFGAFVRIGDHEGLVHISELAMTRVNRTEDAVAVGDRIEVKVLGADEKGRLKLSRRAALQEG
jgi:polyribonucleotide nucleotidyltransferase